MFRSPTEISSDSSESDEVEGPSTQRSSVAETSWRHAVATESLSSNGEYSVTDGQNDDAPQNIRYHSNMLMASLLEDYCRVRAAELLNNGTPGASYTRESHEVRPLAKKLFASNSRALAANNLLPALFTRDDTQTTGTRRQYLAGIDNLGVQTLQDSHMTHSGNGLLDYATGMGEGSAQVFSAGNFDFTTNLIGPLANMSLRNQGLLPTPSPYTDIQIPRVGRYSSEFSHVRLLGQGGFGQVFHVLNFVDKQEYAIKRIPLSAKLVRKWIQHEGTNQPFQEIRTLAKLEHSNIVRYYGAWVESPHILDEESAHGGGHSQKLLANTPAIANSLKDRNRTSIYDHNIYPSIEFGEDSDAIQSTSKDDYDSHLMPTYNKQRNIIAQRERRILQGGLLNDPSTLEVSNPGSTSTVSLLGSEIFTDGHSRSMIPLDLPSGKDSHAAALYLQMSLHSMTLTSYLLPSSADTKRPTSTPVVRHCFHLVPSLRLLLGILCGLQYLHAMGIVHRDIKPGNILLSEAQAPIHHAAGFCDIGSCDRCTRSTPYFLNPRIADFGLVAEIEQSSSLEGAPDRKAVGTEFYRPPAMTGSNKVDEKLDVFALGIVLFEMLWQFNTKMERQMVLGGLSQNGTLPDNFVAKIEVENGNGGTGIAARVAECIEGMVHRAPEQRWTCSMLKQRVEDILAQCQRSPSQV